MSTNIAVVIPCYNRSDVLRRTMQAIIAQTVQPAEVVIVDDASTDDVLSAIRDLPVQAAGFRFELVRYSENKGAPAARNEGARRTTSPYLLFVDADVELKPDALEKMSRVLDTAPEVDFVYANFLWGWKKFQGKAFDVAELRKENWIHTTSLMRRKAFPGFDESLKKFQDWDLWLTMAERGSIGAWLNETLYAVKPKGTMSSWLPRAAYVIPWKRIGWTPKTVQRYEQAKAIIQMKHQMNASASSAMTYIPGVRFWFLATLVLEVVSLLTIFRPGANTVAVMSVAGIMFFLAIFRPTMAVSVLMLELLIGSKGYLLQFGGWPSHLSLRILLTSAFLAGWVINAFRARAWKHWRPLLRGREGYLMLFGVILFAAIRGSALDNEFMFQDVNAWADWVLLLPLLDIASRYKDRIRKEVIPVLMAGVVWLAVKTIALEYVFSHGFSSISPQLYLWVRRTGVGEVTLIVGNAFRIFMQSYIYTIPAFMFATSWWMTESTTSRTSRRAVWETLFASSLLLVISLSRSFWIGSAAGLLFLLGVLIRRRAIRWKQSIGPMSAGIAAVLVLGAVIAFPVPPVNVASFSGLFGSRANMSEAAAVSRWNLLPVLWRKIAENPILGSGYGATVTYQSKDPRVLATNPSGLYSTYAFEWGWLEHWIKFGIIGIPLIAYILWSLGRRLWGLDEPLWFRAGAVASLLSLAIVHVFTPYLNHPLGFLFLFGGEMVLASQIPRREAVEGV